jgi:hypothetical protein
MSSEFDDFNGAIFTIRARGLNNVIYWMCQIFGSLSIGILLDSPRLTRRARAFLGWIILLIMVMGKSSPFAGAPHFSDRVVISGSCMGIPLSAVCSVRLFFGCLI